MDLCYNKERYKINYEKYDLRIFLVNKNMGFKNFILMNINVGIVVILYFLEIFGIFLVFNF